MTTLPSANEAIAESERLIAILERHEQIDPELGTMLRAHRATLHEMKVSHSSSEQAITEWRSALARRWTAEIAVRRLYKQIMRQLMQHYGNADAPIIRLISRGGAEMNSTPSELLDDMRRLQTALSLETAALPFAAQRINNIITTCQDLESAITDVAEYEHRRRAAVLDLRIAREVYRRMRGEAYHTLVQQYGVAVDIDFQEPSMAESTE